MKNQQQIKRLMSNISDNSKRAAELKSANVKSKSKILDIANPIIKIMNRVEKEVMEEKKEQLKYVHRNISPIGSTYFSNLGIGDVESISMTEKFLKIRTSYRSCGDIIYRRYKIPLEYLNMSAAEIEEAHREWANFKLDFIITGVVQSNIKNKEKRIQQLTKELEDLKNNNK